MKHKFPICPIITNQQTTPNLVPGAGNSISPSTAPKYAIGDYVYYKNSFYEVTMVYVSPVPPLRYQYTLQTLNSSSTNPATTLWSVDETYLSSLVWPGASSESLPETEEPEWVAYKPGCNHAYVTYTGLFESYEYCSKCDKKR